MANQGARPTAEEHDGATGEQKDPVQHQLPGLGGGQQLDGEPSGEVNPTRGKGEKGQETVRFSQRLVEAAQRQGSNQVATKDEGGQGEPRGHEDTPRRGRGRPTAISRLKNPKPTVAIQEEMPVDTGNEEGQQHLDEREPTMDQGGDVRHESGGPMHSARSSSDVEEPTREERGNTHPTAGGPMGEGLELPHHGTAMVPATGDLAESLPPTQGGPGEEAGPMEMHDPGTGTETATCCCESLGSQDGPFFGGTCVECQQARERIRREAAWDLSDLHGQVRSWPPFIWFLTMHVSQCVMEYDMEVDVGEIIAEYVDPCDFLETNHLTLEDLGASPDEPPLWSTEDRQPVSTPQVASNQPAMEKVPPSTQAQLELMESIREGQLYLVRELRTRNTEWTQMQQDFKRLEADHTKHLDRLHQLESELEATHKDVAILKGQRDRLEGQVKEMIAHQKGKDYEIRELQQAAHQMRSVLKHHERVRPTTPAARPSAESHEGSSAQHHQDREDVPSPQPPPPPPRTSRAPRTQPKQTASPIAPEDKTVPPPPPPRSVSPPPHVLQRPLPSAQFPDPVSP